MKNVTTKEFKDKIFNFDKSKNWKESFKNNGEKSYIIVYSAQWCGPCRMLSPILEELSIEYKDKIEFFKVDVDEEYELSEYFNIRSVPTLLFVPLKGEPVSQTGAFPKTELKKLITKYIG